jgi:hypothetical protein
MANCYTTTIGSLIFEGDAKITPVIKALFTTRARGEPFLNQWQVAEIPEDTDLTWDGTLEQFQGAFKGVDEINPQDEEEVAEWVDAVGRHLGADMEKLKPFLDHIVDGTDPDLEQVFELAMLLNDGHNLMALCYESANSSDRNDSSGGHGLFVTDRVRMWVHTGGPTNVGPALHLQAMVDDAEGAAQTLMTEVDNLLNSILDPDLRRRTRAHLGKLIWEK